MDLLDIYENKTRQQIMDELYSKKGQGETYRNLSNKLSIPVPTLLWHSRVLEDNNLIIKKKINNEMVIVPTEYYDDFDMDLKVFELTFKTANAKKFYNFLLSLKQNQEFDLYSVLQHTTWTVRTSLRYISRLLELHVIERTNGERGYIISSSFYHKIHKE